MTFSIINVEAFGKFKRWCQDNRPDLYTLLQVETFRVDHLDLPDDCPDIPATWLNWGFDWSRSRQGHGFWQGIYDSLQRDSDGIERFYEAKPIPYSKDNDKERFW